MRTKCTKILTLLMVLLSTIVMAQIQVSGVVKDADGEPLPGAYVESESGESVETDIDGKYTITANQGEKLTFSFIGMDDKVQAVSGNSLNITLGLGAGNEIETVVVTGLGIEREKKTLGYAVSEVSSEEIEKSGEQNLVQALAGKAAGVQVIGTGGTPGASSKVVIRGKKSISLGSDPLIVIDGVRMDNTTTQTRAGDNPFNANLSGVNASNRLLDINPDDIESVSVLKGPAAAALYGEGAGNGVIIYTTKKGKKRRGIGVDIRIGTEFSEVSQLPELQSTYAAGTNGNYIAPPNPGSDKLYFTGDDISYGTQQSWGPNAAEAGIPLYDNVGKFFRTGITNNYNLALSGGSEDATFRVSLGHVNQQGVIPNSELKRTSVRIGGDIDILENLKVGATTTYSRTSDIKVQNGSNLAGIMLGLMRAPASYNLRDYKFDNGYQKTYFALYDNPYYTAYENPMNGEVNRTTGSTYITYTPKEWFNVTLRSGWDVYNDNRRQVFAVSSLGDDNTTGKGQVNYNDILSQNFNANLIFSGQVPLIKEDVLKLNYTTGLEIYTKEYDENYSRGRELAVPGLYNLENASNLYASNYQEKKIGRGLYGQLEFDLKDQLFLTVSGRKDWASSYDEKPFYPAASLSWVASNSFDMPSWISFAKLRYGYAESGLSPDPYTNRTYYSSPVITDGFTNGLSFPYDGQNGYSISSVLGDSDLKPERLLGHEAGVELALFKKRITLDASYYHQTTKDALLYIPVPGSSGFTSQYTNAAEIENKGVEVQLGLDVIRSNNFGWNITANFAKNDNEVIALANGVEQVSQEAAFTSIGSYAIVGYPLGAFFGTRWQRDDSGNLIIGSDGIPLKESTDGNIGNPAPEWTAGIRNSFSWKGLTLSALLDIRKGGDIYNGTRARLNRYGATAESAENRDGMYLIQGVKEDGSVNDIEVDANTYFNRFVGDNGGAAEQFVEDGGWVRLRDVSLAYKFNNFEQVSGLKFIRYVEFTVSGRNLWLDTDYSGVDPETSLTGADSNIDGLDYFNNPGTKSYSFGVKVGF